MFYYLMYDKEGNDAGAMTSSFHLLSSETQVEVTEEIYDLWMREHPEPEPPEPDPEYVSPAEAIGMIEEVLL